MIIFATSIDIFDSIKSNVSRPLWDIVINSECDFGIRH